MKYYSLVHNRLRFFSWLLPFLPSFNWLHVYRFVHGSNGTNERLTYGNRTQEEVVHRVAIYEMMYDDVGGSGSGSSWKLTPHPTRHGG